MGHTIWRLILMQSQSPSTWVPSVSRKLIYNIVGLCHYMIICNWLHCIRTIVAFSELIIWGYLRHVKNLLTSVAIQSRRPCWDQAHISAAFSTLTHDFPCIHPLPSFELKEGSQSWKAQSPGTNPVTTAGSNLSQNSLLSSRPALFR